MNLSQFYKLVLLIVLLGNIYAAQILPIKDENNIRLNIGDRERIYHEIPEEGLKVHLRGYGWVKVFKFVAKNGRIDAH